MSDLEYVVIYHTSGHSSTHPLQCWEWLKNEYTDLTPRILNIKNPWGGATCIERKNIDSIHLVVEDQVETDARRRAQIEKLDNNAKDWDNR
jgi:hypothetical protein